MNSKFYFFIIFYIFSGITFAEESAVSFPAYEYLKSVTVIIVFLALLFFGLKLLTKIKLNKTALPSFDLAVVGRVTVEPGLALYVIKIKDRYKLIASGTKSVSVIDDISDAVITVEEEAKMDFGNTLDHFMKKIKKSDDDKKNS